MLVRRQELSIEIKRINFHDIRPALLVKISHIGRFAKELVQTRLVIILADMTNLANSQPDPL
jgi:hypothetical protein